jgi:hypothetical protein
MARVTDLAENPQETTILLPVLALILSLNLLPADLALLGRLIIYTGQAIFTVGDLLLVKEAEEKAQAEQAKALQIEQAMKKGKHDMAEMGHSVEETIWMLQQQNQYLQEQIWDITRVIAKRM